MESAIAESAIRYDAAGNPALDKDRQQSRIDVLQAAVIRGRAGRRGRRSVQPLPAPLAQATILEAQGLFSPPRPG